MRYYPIYVDLQERHCIVIGGGTIAEGKVTGLLEAGARVTLISPTLTPALRALADEGRFAHLVRGYQPGDLAGALMVISATDDRAINEQVWAEANERQQLVNVVDDVPHCGFIAPSIVRRGDLTIAISTSGHAPVLAVRLRQWLDSVLGDEYARFLELAGTLRAPLARRFPSFEHRKALWYELIDSDVLDLLRQGNEPQARERIEAIMGVAPGA